MSSPNDSVVPLVRNLDDLRYVIIPAKARKDCDFLDVYNTIFSFWEAQWNRAFAATGAPKKHWRDHFLRQDAIVALMNGDEVISCHLYTLYHIKALATRQSEYFEYVTEETAQALAKGGAETLMSMEYLCVNPGWSKNRQNVGLGRLIVALGCYVAEALQADRIIGMPISGTNVDKMAESIGGSVLQAGIKKYGYELQFFVATTTPRQDCKDADTADWARRLWEGRLDYSGLTQPRAVPAQPRRSRAA